MGVYNLEIEKRAAESKSNSNNNRDEYEDYKNHLLEREERRRRERDKARGLIDSDGWYNSLPGKMKNKLNEYVDGSVYKAVSRDADGQHAAQIALDNIKKTVKPETIREFNRLGNISDSIESSDAYKKTYNGLRGKRVKSTLKGIGAGAGIGGGIGLVGGAIVGSPATAIPMAAIGGVTGGLIGGSNAVVDSKRKAFIAGKNKIYPSYFREKRKANIELDRNLNRSWETE